MASYYEDFMTSLKSKLPEDYSIWALGHGGHDIPENVKNYPELSENEHLFDLEATIKQKIQFIDENLDESTQEITLIGHSIGAKMVMEVMKAKKGIKKGCLLFPTVENMITSPAGKRLNFSINYLSQFQVFLAWILSFLPHSILAKCIRFWVGLSHSNLSETCVQTSVELINPKVIKNILYLAKTELDTVLDLNYEDVKNLNDKLWFFYGNSDPWVPLDYVEKLKQNVPGVNAQVCQSDIPHAFVLSHSSEVARIVSDNILK